MAQVLKNLLTDYGYNLVALPKSDLEPLGLLFKRDDGLGSIDSSLLKLFTIADAAPPVIRRDSAVSDIKGSALVTFDAKAGINLLQSLLGHLGLGKASAKLDLNTNHTVAIGYEQITEDKIDLLELDNYISGSDPNRVQFNTFKDKLENSELYVINAVLKSSTFSIKIDDKSGQKVNLDATVVAPSGKTTVGKRLAGGAELTEVFLDAERGKRVLSFLLPLAAFVVLSVTLGMYAATILYLVFAMRFQGGYGWIASLATAILTAAFLYLALEKFFQIGLLKGPLEPLLGL